ncbi:hypothetical protein KIPB_010619, partial [Kipferlia bialata]
TIQSRVQPPQNNPMLKDFIGERNRDRDRDHARKTRNVNPRPAKPSIAPAAPGAYAVPGAAARQGYRPPSRDAAPVAAAGLGRDRPRGQANLVDQLYKQPARPDSRASDNARDRNRRREPVSRPQSALDRQRERERERERARGAAHPHLPREVPQARPMGRERERERERARVAVPAVAKPRVEPVPVARVAVPAPKKEEQKEAPQSTGNPETDARLEKLRNDREKRLNELMAFRKNLDKRLSRKTGLPKEKPRAGISRIPERDRERDREREAEAEALRMKERAAERERERERDRERLAERERERQRHLAAKPSVAQARDQMSRVPYKERAKAVREAELQAKQDQVRKQREREREAKEKAKREKEEERERERVARPSKENAWEAQRQEMRRLIDKQRRNVRNANANGPSVEIHANPRVAPTAASNPSDVLEATPVGEEELAQAQAPMVHAKDLAPSPEPVKPRQPVPAVDAGGLVEGGAAHAGPVSHDVPITSLVAPSIAAPAPLEGEGESVPSERVSEGETEAVESEVVPTPYQTPAAVDAEAEAEGDADADGEDEPGPDYESDFTSGEDEPDPEAPPEEAEGLLTDVMDEMRKVLNDAPDSDSESDSDDDGSASELESDPDATLSRTDNNQDMGADAAFKGVPIKATESDSLCYRIEALRVYLETELGFDSFCDAYRYTLNLLTIA